MRRFGHHFHCIGRLSNDFDVYVFHAGNGRSGLEERLADFAKLTRVFIIPLHYEITFYARVLRLDDRRFVRVGGR